MIDQIKIGSFLRELRKEKELTQEQLAEKFGVSSEYKEGASTILYQYLKEGKPLASAFESNKGAINGDLMNALKPFTK